MSLGKALGGSTGILIGAALVVGFSCRIAAKYPSFMPVCNFKNMIQTSLMNLGGMKAGGMMMGNGCPGFTDMTSCMHMNCTQIMNPACQTACNFPADIQARCKPMPMVMAKPMMPAAKKSMLGYTLSRVAGAHDDDIL